MEHIYDILKITFGAVLGALLTNWVNIRQEQRQKGTSSVIVKVEHSLPEDIIIDGGEITMPEDKKYAP